MEKVRAVAVDPGTKERLVIREFDAPAPQASEALVRVKAISINLGEVRNALTEAPLGYRPGWDLAGIVERPAAIGGGPKAGARVVGLVPTGAWAERVAVPTAGLAEIPDSVSFAQAATLPVAGLTALYGLERNGSLLARRVLITGASGGVGHFACQIARHAGAFVVAAVRRPEREKPAREWGAHEVVVGEDISAAARFGRYHMVLESVGGAVLASALEMLAAGGMCVSCGASASAQATIEVRSLMRASASLYGFYLMNETAWEPASRGLKRMAGMIADGTLKPHIDLESPWTEIAAVADRLYRQRGIIGKAVLTL
ncbi:MAG TPA: zinc-binding dehydrogenase [Candidatus Binataceae bacterium]|nr:zinc-binding dehydrogenase [Candidatus Binataceae bacterium]